MWCELVILLLAAGTCVLSQAEDRHVYLWSQPSGSSEGPRYFLAEGFDPYADVPLEFKKTCVGLP